MEILFVLVPVSVMIMLIAFAAFLWSVYTDQYDDLDMEAERILFDDPAPARKEEMNNKDNTEEKA